MMKVEIVKRETIKPSSPTPHHLKSFKLSILDQFSPLAYSPLVLFYPVVSGDGIGDRSGINLKSSSEKSQYLKRSLSETLTRFFPLAGRIKDSATIDCNDKGVSFFEACVDCLLEKILEQPETEMLKQLVPVDDTKSIEEGMGCLLLVQINFFACGGMAIGVSFSHKVSDAATFSTFIKAWSATALEFSDEAVFPNFNAAAALFPPRDTLPISRPRPRSISSYKCVTKRFLFDALKIAALKAKAASEMVSQPTRVEAISALIWKSATIASRSNSGSSARKQSVLGHVINLRKRIVPPLPENSFGNVVGCFTAQTEDNDELNLPSLVDQLRKGMTDFCNNYASKLGKENGVSLICKSFKLAKDALEKDAYTFTSWCRFPLYEADFGWGKPTWLGSAISAYKNTVILMDTRDGNGVEAYVSLTQEDMTLFENDMELLDSASVNPSALNMVRV